MENEVKDNIKLPDNAFTELKEGEEYQPVMSPDKNYPEVNGWSVTWGVLMAILFSQLPHTLACAWARCSRPPSPSPS